MSNDHFPYFSIDPDRKEIRLMVIAPGHESEAINCALIKASIFEQPSPYKALSYTWGEGSATRPVNVNGRTFFVRRNLERALRRFRDQEEKTWIWIDAICINQADVDERNKHIPYMHMVYQRAAKVVVWLGDASGDSEWLAEQVHLWWSQMDIEIPTVTPQMMTDKFMNGRTLKALRNLFGRPWCTRVWTMQEFVWAETISFFYGQVEMSLSSLTILARMCQMADRKGVESCLISFSASPALDLLLKYRTLRKKSMELTLEHTMPEMRERESTDLRDRVFALLHIVPVSEWPFQPDYTKTIEEVLTGVARHILTKSRKLILLRLCDQPLFPRRLDHLRPKHQFRSVPGLPSWVPDWTRPRVTISLPQGYDYIKPLDKSPDLVPYSADEGSEVFFRFSEEGSRLTVEGIVYDTVRECHPGWSNRSALRAQLLHPRFNLLEHWVSERVKIIEGVGNLPARMIWQTMSAHQVSRLNAKAIADDFDEFRRWQASNGSTEDTGASFLAIWAPCTERILFVTAKGLLGLGPVGTAPGDNVCVLFGSSVPMIVRHSHLEYVRRDDLRKIHRAMSDCRFHGCFQNKTLVGLRKENTLIGESYVHGIMNGEAMEELKCGRVEAEEIELR
ncbi:MAG: hypothetical protein Q9160_008549 [Pyrenula sp. 1 TL-2023]